MQASKDEFLKYSVVHYTDSLRLKGEIRYQIERAALSVVLNLSQRDRVKFFNIAYASQKEVQTTLLIIGNQALADSADMLGAMIYCLQRRILLTSDR